MLIFETCGSRSGDGVVSQLSPLCGTGLPNRAEATPSFVSGPDLCIFNL